MYGNSLHDRRSCYFERRRRLQWEQHEEDPPLYQLHTIDAQAESVPAESVCLK